MFLIIVLHNLGISDSPGNFYSLIMCLMGLVGDEVYSFRLPSNENYLYFFAMTSLLYLYLSASEKLLLSC